MFVYIDKNLKPIYDLNLLILYLEFYNAKSIKDKACIFEIVKENILPRALKFPWETIQDDLLMIRYKKIINKWIRNHNGT